MAADKNIKTVTIRGKAQFAKILGDPIPNYDKTGKEWKMDLEITDKDTIKEIKSLGIGDRIRQKENYLNGSPYISFKQAEFKKDGTTPNKPITVVEADGKTPWDQDKLIGNGSTVDVRFAIIEYPAYKKTGCYIRAVRVLDHVSYERPLFDPLDEEDEFYSDKSSDENTLDDSLDFMDEAV